MFAQGILKVIYAPHKAFKEIIQNPKYLGPLLIMILFVLANAGYGYVILSKAYLEQTAPQAQDLDKWTEDSPQLFWSSNASITTNTTDYISGTYYGNKSVEFSLVDSSQVWMQLNVSSPLNCSGPEGYKNVTFRIKLVQPPTAPSNVSLYLLSTKPQDNFYHDITDELNETGLWENITLQFASGWTPSSSDADWGNITGLKLEFAWSAVSNSDLLIDGLFFHGVYAPAIESRSGLLINSPINAFMQFTIQWVTLGGLLYAIPKIFKAKTAWKPMIIIAGFALITILIQILIYTVLLSVMPEIRYSFEALSGVPGEAETAYAQVVESARITDLIFRGVEIAVYIWTIALCAIALRLMFAFDWMKSLFMSSLAYLFSLFVFRFITYGAIWL